MDLRHPKINFSPHQKIGDLISGSVSMKRKSGQSIRRLLLIYNQLDLDDTTQIWAIRGQFAKEGLQDILPEIEEWKAVKLYLWSNQQPRIIHQIMHIKLKELKEIHLGWNNIESISELNRLQAPNLQQLVLRDNKIKSASCLRKCCFEKLGELCLRGNPLSELDLDCLLGEKLSSLNLNQIFLMDHRAVFKLQSTKIKTLSTKTHFSSLTRQHKSKFPQLTSGRAI